ncbi:hypothetical protein IEQ34_003892 [Dendrobium chrysotoxum]|uniref:Uncharacterized protein n=1 Tax=Dendrobium chrysotoxum TaxID=161865 RepID=A0AAV7HFR4_DENCH|nr:hypothetical protein IEQ34_003892 [Dendrobium chrysotoxum]
MRLGLVEPNPHDFLSPLFARPTLVPVGVNRETYRTHPFLIRESHECLLPFVSLVCTSKEVDRNPISSSSLPSVLPREILMQIINQHEVVCSIIFRQKDFNLQMFGIGGLGEEFAQIFHRAFATHVFPPRVINKSLIQIQPLECIILVFSCVF